MPKANANAEARASSDEKMLLDAESARVYLGGIARSFLYVLVETGQLRPPVHLGRRRFWVRSDLDAFIQQLREQGGVA